MRVLCNVLGDFGQFRLIVWGDSKMRIVMVTFFTFFAVATLGIVLNQTVGYLIHPYVILGSIPGGLAIALITRHWFKMPNWIKKQMIDPEGAED